MPFSVSLPLPRSDLRPGHAPNQVTTGESRDETSLVPDTSPPLSLFIHQPHHQSTVTSGSHSHTSWPPMPHAAPPTVLKNTAKITPQLSRASVGWRDWRGPAVALLHPIPFQTQRQAILVVTIRNDCASALCGRGSRGRSVHSRRVQIEARCMCALPCLLIEPRERT